MIIEAAIERGDQIRVFGRHLSACQLGESVESRSPAMRALIMSRVDSYPDRTHAGKRQRADESEGNRLHDQPLIPLDARATCDDFYNVRTQQQVPPDPATNPGRLA